MFLGWHSQSGELKEHSQVRVYLTAYHSSLCRITFVISIHLGLKSTDKCILKDHNIVSTFKMFIVYYYV